MRNRGAHHGTATGVERFQFEGLVKPVHDETLSSWLIRVALSESILAPWLVLALDMITTSNPEFEDPDLLYTNERLIAQMPPGIQTAIQSHFHISEMLNVPYSASYAYCHVCLQGDIAAGRAPSWRRAWRLKGRALCHAHLRPVLLGRLSPGRYDIAKKTWAAFCEYVESPASRLRTSYVLTYFPKELISTIDSRLNALLKRVEDWCLLKVLKGHVQELSPEAAQFLLVLWMYNLGSGNYGCGVAISLAFNSRHGHSIARTTAEDPLGTIYNANPRALAVAYWLLGMAYDVITTKDALFIQKALYSNSITFPIGRDELAAYSRGALSSEAARPTLKSLRKNLSCDSLAQIAWLGLPRWLAWNFSD
ncbi:TniQ family protein [Pseudomonas tremae]|uniref:TniQ family protein n=1 Tax=Pseudomonas tremae TaxID=200454 RepID=UPI001F2AD9CD|nr:TniQ family protein [Pseudomonas tremae]MCF5803939.1 hypothetical protein [Pseudomonas tremae]MCF5810239.1 hypothetical protein [Pseudomonas tremae]